MADDIGLLLRLILDKAGKDETKKGFDEVSKSIDSIKQSMSKAEVEQKKWNEAVANQTQVVKNAKKDLADYEKAYKSLLKSTDENSNAVQRARKKHESFTDVVYLTEQRLKDYKNKLKEANDVVEKYNDEVKELSKFSGMSSEEIKKLTAEEYAAAKGALEAQKQIQKFNKELQETERRVADMRQLSTSIGRISQGLFLAGSAVTTTFYVSANKEAQRIKEAGGVVDETTQKWLLAQERIQRSYQRIGRSAMTAMLPVLEDAAALAERASKFVEKNPDLVRSVLKTGQIVAVVGAVGMLAARGIKFVADATLIAAQFKYSASTLMFKQSVDRFFAAQTRPGGGGYGWQSYGGGTPSKGGTGASALGTLGTVTLIATSVIIGAEIGKEIGNKIAKAIYGEDYKDQNLGDAAQTYYRAAALPSLLFAVQLKKAGFDEAAKKISDFTLGVDKFIGKVSDAKNPLDELSGALDNLSDSTETAAKDLEGAKIIANLERANLEAEREYSQARAKVLNEANASIREATLELANARARIRASLGGTLSKLSFDFQKANQEADQNYQLERAKIAQDGNEEILRIQKDAQEELRKLTEDFAREEDQLTRERDALGLVKARRKFEDDKKEIEREKTEQIKESRKQTAQQLADLRQSYQRERAERLAKYQQDVADAKAQAAQELAEAQTAFNQRMAEIQRQKQIELAELARAYNEERRRRVLAAYEQIKDLNGALGAERLMRSRYYAIINAEAAQFMAQYRATLSAIKTGTTSTVFGSGIGGGSIPTSHSGGYTGDGIYMMKRGEYVMNPATVQAAESLIGSQLSQQALINTLASGVRSSATLVDQRRFNAEVSPSTRREIASLAVQEMKQLLNGIGARRR